MALGVWINNQREAYKGKGTNKISGKQIKLLDEIGMIWITKNAEKLQQEQITVENLKRKKRELQNRTYSVLNNYDNESLPLKEELNEKFLNQLNHNIHLK